jgi:hypothetical protein
LPRPPRRNDRDDTRPGVRGRTHYLVPQVFDGNRAVFDERQAIIDALDCRAGMFFIDDARSSNCLGAHHDDGRIGGRHGGSIQPTCTT